MAAPGALRLAGGVPVGALLALYMALQVADIAITEALVGSGRAVELNPWMATTGARLYAKPVVGLALCAVVLGVLPPRARGIAALALVGVATVPFLFLGFQLLLP